jgi:hypothetical protein
MPTVLEVKPLEGYRIWLRFSDGVEGIANLSEFAGKGVFQLWDVDDEFRNVRIGESGGIEWGELIDMCPDALYLRITGKTPEELFPRLRNLVQHAGN